MTEDNKFDGILMSIIQQKGNIDGFFDSVFGFLRRNTDFFANQKKAQQIIVNTCKTNFDKYSSDAQNKKKQEQKRKEAEQKKKKQRQEKQLKEKLQKQKKTEKKVQVKEQVVKEEKKEQKKEEGEQDNTPAPLGNGGRTDKYIWVQTLQNLDMYIFLDSSINKKQLKVNIAFDKLYVNVAGNDLINGKWFEKINTDDSFWTIQDSFIQDYKGKYIHIVVEKWKNQSSWWKTPVQGDQQINTQKINPESSKLSDLDGQTRSTVEKMMFDMKQKQQGLPSSDQLQKQQKLKEFMKAHPEMDFSKCKFN